MTKDNIDHGHRQQRDRMAIIGRIGLDPGYWIYRFKWLLATKRLFLPSFPMHLDIEATNICNLRCRMCAQNTLTDKKGYMDFELYKKIIDEGAGNGLYAIKLHFRGEPLLHPRITEMIRYAKRKGIIDVMFTTNATLLREDLAEALLESGLDQIMFSVNGHTKRAVEDIEVGADYGLIMDNIHRFLDKRRRKRLPRPLVRVQMVRTEGNRGEEREFLKKWRPLADTVATIDCFVPANRRLREEMNYRAERSDIICSRLWQRIPVFWNGEAGLCCIDSDNEVKLGDARVQSIKDIWGGARLKEIRRLHLEGRMDEVPLCRRCGFRENHAAAQKELS
ncbi:MAG: radical SAM protein [Candidatus Omnitrophota bacterium]